VRILLDTHAVLWFLSGDARLSGAARSAIEDLDNERLCSIASLWEIAIKTSLGKLPLAKDFAVIFPSELLDNDIQLLPISPGHLHRVATLPFHHRDPFDRLLVAQAMMDDLVLVSRDSLLDAYGVQRYW
jgi:PIN domain nuclease of toxin-antitoxin system